MDINHEDAHPRVLLKRTVRKQHAYFRNPPIEWRGTAQELRYHRRDCARMYAYLKNHGH